ncbi:MAG: rhodanese-related sulfurtransferase [Natronomonas sp.]|jgi:rhodanese-related sulfurtransferase|uniref:rhodanese-like domain-containing protein n=1 Tax=Natronomonas sp. TaxID=2184060 RepID=UPI0039895E4B
MDGEISAAELKELLDADADVRIVDIRSPPAFRRGHIPNSENIPFQELTGRIEEFVDADRVVTACPHGKASVQAARLIDSYEGFSGRVDSLETGIDEWPHALEAEESVAEAGGDEGPDAPF